VRASWRYEESKLLFKATDFQVLGAHLPDADWFPAFINTVVPHQGLNREYSVELGPFLSGRVEVQVFSRNAVGGYVSAVSVVSCRVDADAPAATPLAFGAV